MGRRRQNLARRHFGKLIVTSRSRSRRGADHPEWWCRCSCGSEIWVRSGNLLSGNTKSCGMCKWAPEAKLPVEDALGESPH